MCLAGATTMAESRGSPDDLQGTGWLQLNTRSVLEARNTAQTRTHTTRRKKPIAWQVGVLIAAEMVLVRRHGSRDARDHQLCTRT